MILNMNECKYDENLLFKQVLNVSKDFYLHKNNIEVEVNAILTKNAKFYLFKGVLKTNLETVCCKCLKIVNMPLNIDIEERFSEDHTNSEKYETFLIENKTVNLTEVFLTNIYLNIPLKFICSENCKGLCSVCGCNKNINFCNCNNNFVDQRFVNLKNLLTNKEV